MVANKINAESNEKVELLQSFLKQGTFVNFILHESIEDKKTSYHLRRGPVVHAMILTYDKNQDQAKKFWLDVRDGENLRKTMPAYKLRSYLTMVVVNEGTGARYGSAVRRANALIWTPLKKSYLS